MVIRKSYRRTKKAVKQTFENNVVSIMRKFGYASAGVGMGEQDPEPPYERGIPHQWLYRLRRNQSLVNNAIEEKVNQTFRRGFTEWEKEYIAKCPHCHKEFDSAEPFREQLGGADAVEDLEAEDLDFSKPRPCPNEECPSHETGELVDYKTPDPEDKQRAEEFWQNANEQGYDDAYLDGEHQNSIGQTVEEVCKEVALDIQTFDDGWMVFERTYWTDHEGVIQDWDLDEIHRGAPEVMRYSFNKAEGKLGHERWVCVECRANDEHYTPQKDPGPCDHCGNRTYMAYAKRMDQPNGNPVEWYIRGEFAHGSEYHPSKFYGYSPIISVWEEARTLENMDDWYKDAYEERRAPRGALVIRSSNAQSVRTWNQEQMQALRDDPNHIPTFMDDTEGRGDPLTWQPLLEDPANMQHMQMREWFLDRISAKFGVTAVFQSAAPSDSGLSQSMEIIVSNRSAQKLKEVFEDIFIPAILTQLQADGWTREIKRIEEEDEAAEAQRIGTELRNAQLAAELGREVEWTDEDQADIKPGMFEAPEGGEEGGEGEEGGGMMDMPGGGDEEGPPDGDEDVAGETSTAGGRPNEADQRSGAPDTPRNPTTDDPIQRGEGTHSPAYGGDPETVIDLFSQIEEKLTDDGTTPDEKEKWEDHARHVFDAQFGAFGPKAETIKEYAESGDKEFRQLREDKYGPWLKSPLAEQAAMKLYEIYHP